MATNIELVVTAKDEATRVLQVVQRQMEIFPEFARTTTIVGAGVDRASRSLEGFEFSASKAARGIRALATPILSELSPALGVLGPRIASVVTASAALGTGLGALALGATTLAAVLGGRLIQSWRESAAAAEAYQRAVRVGDIEAISAAVSKQAEEVLRLGRAHRAAEDAAARARGAGDGPEGGAGAGSFFAAAADRGAEAARKQLADTQRDLDLARQATAEGEALLRSEQDLKRIEEDRAKLRASNVLADRSLGDSRLDPIERAYREQVRDAGDRAAAGDVAGAARLRADAATQRSLALGQRFAAGAPANPFESVAGQAQDQAARNAILVEAAKDAEARIAAFQAGAPVNPFETEGGQEADRRARERLAVQAEQTRIEQSGAQAQLAAELLELERQRLDLAGQLTPELSAQLTQMQAAAIASDARLTPEQRALALAQAQLRVWQDLAALDPLQGLITGFSRVATESRKLGTELERFADETAGNMSRSFSDQFFDLFTGKKGEDIGKRFAESMLRSVSDVLGRQLSGAASGLFAQALGGFRAAVPGGTGGGFGDLLSLFGGGGGGGAILSPTGAPAGSFVMTQNGLAQVMPSGALGAVGGGGGAGLQDLLGLGSQFNSLSGQFGGPTLSVAGAGASYAAAVAATPLSAIAQFGFTTAVAQTQAGLALGFGAKAGGTTFAVAGATGGAPLTSVGLAGPATAGLSVAGAATGVLAGIALGFTIYGGLTQEQTAQNIAMNAISGAISGAVLGAVIGTIVPGIGNVLGAVIGAVVGGAAAGGTTGIKAPKKMSTAEKSAKIGDAAATNLVSAIDRASSIEDLVQIFNTRWAPHGEVQIMTSYDGVFYWAGDFDDPAAGVATPELMIIPEFLDALQIQVGQTGAPQLRPELVERFKAKRNELLGILADIPIAVLERDAAAGVSRRTYQPFTTIYGMPAGKHAIVGSSALYRRDLGADDPTIDFLMDRIRERSVRKDTDITRDDFLFR